MFPSDTLYFSQLHDVDYNCSSYPVMYFLKLSGYTGRTVTNQTHGNSYLHAAYYRKELTVLHELIYCLLNYVHPRKN